MLKLGIHRADSPQLYDGSPLEDRVAFPLLRTEVPASPREVDRFNAIMKTLRLHKGVYRTTTSHRFRELDQFVLPLLEERFEVSDPLHVEDWAVSAGITSVEWFEVLVSRFPRLTMTASDLHLDLVEVQVPGTGTFVLDAEGNALQFLKGKLVIPLHREEKALFLVNYAVQRWALSRLQSLREAGILQFGALETRPAEWRSGHVVFRKIPLIHPRALTLSSSTDAFQFEMHSVFTPREAGSCDVIRSMNIFNRSYFPEPQLCNGIRCVWESLRLGGVWIVGRTLEEQPGRPNQASVYQKSAEGFCTVAATNGSSEISNLVSDFKA